MMIPLFTARDKDIVPVRRASPARGVARRLLSSYDGPPSYLETASAIFSAILK